MPIVLDASGEMKGAYSIVGTPTVYLLDGRGLIIGRAIGMRDWEGPKGRALLEALLADAQR